MRSSLLALVACIGCLCAAEGPAPSQKRGVCYNTLNTKDAVLLSRGVSWCYNWWHKADRFMLSKDAPLDWYPMVWGAEQDRLQGLKSILASGFRPDYILSLNEPNLRGQAFIPPEEMARWQQQVEVVAKQYDIPVIGPHMALGSAEKDSIKAHDPLEDKQVTYTFMVPYLNAYYHFLGGVDGQHAVAVHSYGDISELRWMIDMLDKTYGKPIWVTEFAWWGASDMEKEMEYMIQAVDLFERSPAVHKYAWFKTRMGKDNRMSLLEQDGSVLTRLGAVYLSMPNPGHDHIWNLPARIEAERYNAEEGLSIKLSKDEDGVLDMQFDDVGDQMSFLVSSKRAKNYQVSCRATGDGVLALRSGGKLLARFTVGKGYADSEQKLRLPKGTLRLQLVLESGLVRVNHLTIARP